MSLADIELPAVAFKRWAFWSDWADVCVFTHGYTAYILQCRRNRFNRLRFRAAACSGLFGFAYCNKAELPRKGQS